MQRPGVTLTSPHAIALIALSLTTGVAYAAHRQALPFGLDATYREGSAFEGPSFFRGLDTSISTDGIDRRLATRAPSAFSVVWQGFFIADADGVHRFRVSSDDGARLFLDGALLVDNGGRHGMQPADASRSLAAGSHHVRLEYVQDGGDHGLKVEWALADDGYQSLVGYRLSPRRIDGSGVWLRSHLEAIWCAVAFMWTMGLGVALCIALRRAFVQPLDSGESPTNSLIATSTMLALVLPLNLWAIWWGLPDARGWGLDEILPIDVLAGIDRGFSNGWSVKYPPLQYYVLTILYSPFLAGRALLGLDLSSELPNTLLFSINRLTCTGMAAATIAITRRWASELAPEPTPTLTAITSALVLPFVFYAKSSNLDAPYIFWLSIALWAYVRIENSDDAVAYRVFAAAAACAVCTKDQAYAFFVLPAIRILLVRARRMGASLDMRSARRVLLDRRLLSSAVLAIALFVLVHNLAFNLAGFRRHMATITGPASEDYAMYPSSAAGQISMAADALYQLRWCFGWPMFICCIVGLAAEVRRPATERRLVLLLLPVASYYMFFIAIVRYHYDRFFIGVCFILAFFGARWLSDRARSVRQTTAAAVAAALLLGFGVWYAASIDALMAADSRYEAERWLRTHVGRSDVVGSSGLRENLPRLSDFTWIEIRPSSIELEQVNPAFVVLNRELGRRFQPGSDQRRWYESMEAGDLGYDVAFRYKAPVPWSILSYLDEFRDGRQSPFTNLDKVNPEILVLRRRDP